MNVNKHLIDFLIEQEVLRFEEVTAKSGRKTPYFLDFGRVCSGTTLSKLGEFYATMIAEKYGSKVNVIFGPAYKGISLAIATSKELSVLLGKEIYFSFNRKEKKDHGEKSILVGKPLQEGDNVVIVEDVITAGTTVREVLPLIESFNGVNLLGMVVAVDRKEKMEISDAVTARETLMRELEVEICSLTSIHEILNYLSVANSSGLVLTSDRQSRVQQYLGLYGA
jgi:orotate phosphoribosyltransferase